MSKKTETTREQLQRMRGDLVKLRDEIRVKLHLARMDLKDEVAKLEPEVEAFEHRAEKTTEQVGSELRKSWAHLKKALERVRDELYAKSA